MREIRIGQIGGKLGENLKEGNEERVRWEMRKEEKGGVLRRLAGGIGD